MAKFKINQSGLDKAVADATAKVQVQVNDVLRATIREVRDEMTGQPADDVLAELKTRLSDRIAGINFNDETLREYAQAITDGTLVD